NCRMSISSWYDPQTREYVAASSPQSGGSESFQNRRTPPKRVITSKRRIYARVGSRGSLAASYAMTGSPTAVEYLDQRRELQIYSLSPVLRGEGWGEGREALV